MHYSGDPPAICCYPTTFLSITRPLLFSLTELAKEVGTDPSQFRRFLSLSGHAWSQPKLTGWTKDRLLSSLDQARQVRVPRNDLTKEFLVKRYFPHCGKEDMQKWRWYKENIGYRHYWSRALLCNFDWDWDLSSCLKRLFQLPKTANCPIRSCVAQKNEWSIDSTASCVPVLLKVRYVSQAGKIKYKTFHADPSLEDITARNHSPDDSTLLSLRPEEPVADSSSSKGRLEYKNVLEYREINRHARRKIEAWLNDGWSVEWEWNGLDDWDEDDLDYNSGWRYNANPLATHRMTLRRSKANLPPSASNKRVVLEFPE